MVIKTFKQLQDDALRWFDEVDNTSELRDNVKQAINVAHLTRLSERAWPFMKWPEPVTFNTVVGQRSYALHLDFLRPLYFYNQTTQKWMREVHDNTLITGSVTENTLAWLDESPSNSQTGSAYRFQLRGISPVQTQPSAASVLTVSSSSVADTSSNKTVIVRGETADGIDEETITCGTSGTVQFTEIIKVTKVGTWSGTMTLKAGTTTLLKLSTSETGRKYQVLYLLTEPSLVETVEYLFMRQPTALVNDDDIPDIPSPFADILVYDALIDLATYNPVEAASLKVWMARADALEKGLFATYSEALSLEREVEYVPYIPRE